MAITCAPAPVTWTLRTVAGSVAEYAVTLALTDGNPYPVDGATWEYVVRVSSRGSGRPLLSVTTTPSESGVITVATSPATVVTLTLYPAATAALSGVYRHSLWMNAGTPGAFAWVTGDLSVTPVPGP